MLSRMLSKDSSIFGQATRRLEPKVSGKIASDSHLDCDRELDAAAGAEVRHKLLVDVPADAVASTVLFWHCGIGWCGCEDLRTLRCRASAFLHYLR